MVDALQGRRRVRTESEVIALDELEQRKVIYLSRRFMAAQMKFIREFQNTGCIPIPQKTRDEIIADCGFKSDGATIVGQLRAKGALQSSGSTDIVPCYANEIYVASKSQQIEYPLEFKGKHITEVFPETTSEIVENVDPHPVSAAIFVLPPQTQPVKLRGARLTVYAELIKIVRLNPERLIHPETTRSLVRKSGLSGPGSVTNAFDWEYKIFLRICGTPKSAADPCMRALVLQPYMDNKGKLVVPKECFQHPSANGSATTSSHSGDDQSVASTPVPMSPRLRSKDELEKECEDRVGTIENLKQRAIEVRDHHTQSMIDLEHKIEEYKRLIEEAQQKMACGDDVLADKLRFVDQAIETETNLVSRLQFVIERYDDTMSVLFD